MQLTLEGILEWNRLGGVKLLVYPEKRREIEAEYIQNNRRQIRERRIGLKEAIVIIWNA